MTVSNCAWVTTTVSILLGIILSDMVGVGLAHCDYDPSFPCECTNPFLGTENYFLGDPNQNCKSAKACYVKTVSGCKDRRQSKGGGRCQSKEACNPPVADEHEECSDVKSKFVFAFISPYCFISGGVQICECLNNCECEGQDQRCEVSCASDCNDLKRCKDQKCFSRLACDRDLLFECNKK